MGNAPKWHTLGQSVRGASHVRSDLPNQDAIAWYPKSGDGPPLIVAVSDGHGSPRSFRSDVGSRFAVEQMVALIKDLLNVADSPPTLSAVKRLAEERLPHELVRRWREAVDKHHAKHSFTKAELDKVEDKRGAAARREAEKDPYLAYGATILGVLVTENFILYVQLGDGDILSVTDDHDVTRPVPGDERLFANATTSLCAHNAWRDVRYRFQPLYSTPPALIMLSSDGYANSFISDSGFLKVATDILDILREDGVASVADNLESWLIDASLAGSGDDITLALLFRDDVPAPANKKAKAVKNTVTPAPDPVTENISTKATELTKPEPKSSAKAEKVEATTVVDEPPVKEEHITEGSAIDTESTSEPEAESTVQLTQTKLPAPPASSDEVTSAPLTVEEDAVEPKKRKRRIKDEDGPYELSKKADTIYFED